MPGANIEAGGHNICPKCGYPEGQCGCTMADDNTELFVNKAKEEGKWSQPDARAPYGYYKGRPIIGRDSPINEGVYTAGADEAIVVDEKYGRLLECWQEFSDKINQKIDRGDKHKEGIFVLIKDFVKEKMPYDRQKVEGIVDQIRQQNQSGPTIKIALDVFIEAGAGVCRHQALLAGYLLEKLINETYIGKDGRRRNYLNGDVSVDRSRVPKEREGHAWARYKTSLGEIVIVDPAMNFVGTFHQADEERLRRLSDGHRLWYYQSVRHDDRQPEDVDIISGEPEEIK